jgi:hypothetical protein
VIENRHPHIENPRDESGDHKNERSPPEGTRRTQYDQRFDHVEFSSVSALSYRMRRLTAG